MRPYQVCTRCVMDTTDPEITFDDQGYCNHCNGYLIGLKDLPSPDQDKAHLDRILTKMKIDGKDHDYDCIVGLSGGCDSSFLAFKVVELGLRPLAVHFDSGWNTEFSKYNIQKVVDYLKLDLLTLTCDWEEMRELQRSFFMASLINCDIPQDHAFIAALYQIAIKQNIHYWISGHDYRGSESILAPTWRGYDSRDWCHIKGVHKAMGGNKLNHYPHYTLFDYFFSYPLINKIHSVNLFSFMPYNKIMAKEYLVREIHWKDYTGKHNESILTRFIQGYYLPEKFGYDKRRAHLSSLIMSNQITREDALAELADSFYSHEQLLEEMQFMLNKLGFTIEEWQQIMKSPPKTYRSFPNNSFIFRLHYTFRKLGSQIKGKVFRRFGNT